LKFLTEGDLIPIEFRSRYIDVVEKIVDLTQSWFAATPVHRLHGDCHLGNLLWSAESPFFLDFDDMVRGPAVQDVWLLLPGRDAESQRQLEDLLEGYEEMRVFDRISLRLIEPLRALRFVHYSAWVARRWEDPAFPLAFPQFGTHRYWNDETEDLQNQLRLIEERGGQE
jgi:Ser/Thr protein kinase RdoA (MazF antagonist)